MFDSEVHTDPIPARRAACHPGNPTVGQAAGCMLRNAYIYSRFRGRGGIAVSYPRNLRIPAALNYWAPTVNDAGGSVVVQDRRYVRAHWTHFVAQLCFTILDDADTVTLNLYAADGTHTNVVNQVMPISTGSEARVPNGETAFEGRGASYEAILAVPLTTVAGSGSFYNLSKPSLLMFLVSLSAFAQSKDASPVTTFKTLIMDSLSTWLECQEVG